MGFDPNTLECIGNDTYKPCSEDETHYVNKISESLKERFNVDYFWGSIGEACPTRDAELFGRLKARRAGCRKKAFCTMGLTKKFKAQLESSSKGW